MNEKDSYCVAIDILCCHLGMSLEQAYEELGIKNELDNNIINQHNFDDNDIIRITDEAK